MANIQNEIEQIISAIYGRQVRSALANGLTAVNNQVNNIQNNVGTLTQEAQNALTKANTTENIYNQANIKIEQLINQFNAKKEDLINEINEKEDNLISEINSEKEQLINSYNQTNSEAKSIIELLNNSKEKFFNTYNSWISDINSEFTEGQYAYSSSTKNLPSWASEGLALVLVTNGDSGVWHKGAYWMWQILFDASGKIGFRKAIPDALTEWEILADESYINNKIDSLFHSEFVEKGYMEINGFILQWGYTNFDMQEGVVAKKVQFPITFPSGVVYADTNIYEKNNQLKGPVYNMSTSSIPLNNSEMLLCVNHEFGKWTLPYAGQWFAIGY